MNIIKYFSRPKLPVYNYVHTEIFGRVWTASDVSIKATSSTERGIYCLIVFASKY